MPQTHLKTLRRLLAIPSSATGRFASHATSSAPLSPPYAHQAGAAPAKSLQPPYAHQLQPSEGSRRLQAPYNFRAPPVGSDAHAAQAVQASQDAAVEELWFKELLATESGRDGMRRLWEDVLQGLQKEIADVMARGSEVIPELSVLELPSLAKDTELINRVRTTGAFILRDVVRDNQALQWARELLDDIERRGGSDIYWTRSQVEARSHPTILSAHRQVLSALFNNKEPTQTGVTLSNTLNYVEAARVTRGGQTNDNTVVTLDGYSRAKLRRRLDLGWSVKSVQDAVWDASAQLERGPTFGLFGCANTSGTLTNTFKPLSALLSLSPSQASPMCVLPNLPHTAIYSLLRPHFAARKSKISFVDSAKYLAASNWELLVDGSKGDEVAFSHFDLASAVVPVKDLNPGDVIYTHQDLLTLPSTSASPTLGLPITPLPSCALNEIYTNHAQLQAFQYGQAPPSGSASEQVEQVADVAWFSSDAGRRAMGL